MVIGLTGGIATGKSTVTKLLIEKGYHVIDCDKIAHDIILKPSKCYYELIEAFSINILDGEEICRNKLREIVFNNSNQLNKLNSIMHPNIYLEVKNQIKDGLCFIDCPLLFETNFIDLCDKTLVVYTDFNIQLDRLMKRNNIDKEEAIKRINLQMSLEEKKNQADYVIMNNEDLITLELNLNNFLSEVVYENF